MNGIISQCAKGKIASDINISTEKSLDKSKYICVLIGELHKDFEGKGIVVDWEEELVMVNSVVP